MSARPRLVVIGAGITGLAAAYEAHHAGVDVTVVDGDDRVGGKVATSPLAGIELDAGPDAFLARVPHAVELCRELGLGSELVAPAARRAYVWAGGALRPFPERLLFGVPTDLDALAASGVVSAAGVARAAEDLERPADGPGGDADEPVGELVRRRLGPEVLDALVDPLLSGVFAGDTNRLSVQAGAPQIAAAARRGASLIAGARAQLALASPDPDAPVFLTLPGGLSRLVGALVDAIGPGRVLTGTTAHQLHRAAGGRFSVGATGPRGSSERTADGVLVTTPAPAAAALLAPLAPTAGALLRGIEYASVVLVSFAYPAAAVARPLDASGFLVPRSAGLLMTACSWASTKFTHLGADGIVRLRVSAGRWGDRRVVDLTPDRLVDGLRRDLRTTMGIEDEPLEVRVSPWPGSLPQYTVGHLDRISAVEADLSAVGPGLAATGAAFRGVGLPACIDQGRSAVRQMLTRLG